jgi:hypothetical protein
MAMANETRTIIPRGTVYLGGQVHGFAPGTALALPETVAAALDAAKHTVVAVQSAPETPVIEPAAEAKPA